MLLALWSVIRKDAAMHIMSTSWFLSSGTHTRTLSLSFFPLLCVLIFRKWGNLSTDKDRDDELVQYPAEKQEKVSLDYLQEQNIFLPWNSTRVSIPRDMLTEVKNTTEFSSLPSTLSDKLFSKAEGMVDVILLPSPGEQFSLHISCFDEVFNEAKTTIFAQVSQM